LPTRCAWKNDEAQAASNGEPDAATSGIQQLLNDGKPHVFVAGQDLDVVDAGGMECAVSEGDAFQLSGQTAPDVQAATLAVLASKGGEECAKRNIVSVALTDLQDMRNHMRETIDQGLQELRQNWELEKMVSLSGRMRTRQMDPGPAFPTRKVFAVPSATLELRPLMRPALLTVARLQAGTRIPAASITVSS
jgi:hypothetical protein